MEVVLSSTSNTVLYLHFPPAPRIEIKKNLCIIQYTHTHTHNAHISNSLLKPPTEWSGDLGSSPHSKQVNTTSHARRSIITQESSSTSFWRPIFCFLLPKGPQMKLKSITVCKAVFQRVRSDNLLFKIRKSHGHLVTYFEMQYFLYLVPFQIFLKTD